MKRHLSSRWLLAIALVAAWLGAVRAAGRSPAVMADGCRYIRRRASRPNSVRQASFPVEGDEWTHWHFIPTDMFPRKGLTIKSMTEPQRQLRPQAARVRPQPARLSDRDRRSWISRTSSARSKRRVEPTMLAEANAMVRDPERYFFSVFGTPSATGDLGLARRRASRLAALHGRQRQRSSPARRRFSDRIPLKCARGRRRDSGFLRLRKIRRAPCSWRWHRRNRSRR